MKFATPYENGEICQHFGRAPQFKIFEVTPQGVQEAVIVDTQGSGHEAISEFLAAPGTVRLSHLRSLVLMLFRV